MYCPSCGATVKKGLSYCNRCGAELSAKESSAKNSSEIPQESLVWAVVAVNVGGLALLVGLLAVMKEANFDVELIVAFTALSFLIMIGISSVLIWLLLRSKSNAKKADDKAQLKALTTNELDAPQARALPEPVLSVTEHTTRTLESADKDHK